MRVALWAIVAVLVVLVLAGEKVRGYFKVDVADVAPESGQAFDNRGNAKPSADKPQAGKPSSTGSYVPSPADAPELYDSPTRRLGF